METPVPVVTSPEENRIPLEYRKKFWVVIGLLYLIHAVTLGALAYFFQPSDDRIILRYNVYFGIDILASWWQSYLLPLLSLAFITGNTLFAYRFLKRGEWLLSIILLLGSAVITFGLVIAVSALIFINY